MHLPFSAFWLLPFASLGLTPHYEVLLHCFASRLAISVAETFPFTARDEAACEPAETSFTLVYSSVRLLISSLPQASRSS